MGVWLGHMDVPGLAMSRSLCDAVAHSAGVSSEPEFVEYEFSQGREDLILVLASDGLWEFMSDQEVMDIAVGTTEPRYAVDKVAQSIKGKLASYLFKHREFATNVKAAITDVVAKIEG